MRTIIIILLSLLFLNTAASGQGFRERKSPQGRRPMGLQGPPLVPPPRFRPNPASDGTTEQFFWLLTGSTTDGDAGSNDEVRIASVGHTNMDLLVVYDLKNLKDVWTFDFQTILGVDDIRLFGFYKFRGDDSIQALLVKPSDDSSDLWIVNFDDKAVAFSLPGIRLLGVANVNGEGGPEILVSRPNEGVVSIIGFLGNGNAASKYTRLTSNTGNFTPPLSTSDYELALKFESKPDRQLAFESRLFRRNLDFDIDRDDIMDVALLVENANGDPVGMEVRDGDSFDVKFEYTFPQEFIDNILMGFHGFHDTDGDGKNEVILGNNIVVTLDGMLHQVAENFEILVVYDVDDDGLVDLIGKNSVNNTVQVWGAASPTSVTEADLAIAGFQLQQNYPNPFNPSTTINYSIETAGLIELKIYDLLGRKVRTLVDDSKSSGEYTAIWDGTNDFGQQVASGQYFYQIKAGELQSTRAMILLK